MNNNKKSRQPSRKYKKKKKHSYSRSRSRYKKHQKRRTRSKKKFSKRDKRDKWSSNKAKSKHRHKKSKKSDRSKKSKKKKSQKDEIIHYDYQIGEIIKDRYKITKFLGDGTFGRVLEMKDLKYKKYYAVKVIRAVKRYIESAEEEAQIIYELNDIDVKDKYQIVKLYKTFHYHDHYFMIFEPLGLSLYQLLKKNKHKGYSIRLIRKFAKQIFKSIGFMHKNHCTHTDLKPENILIQTEELKKVPYIKNHTKKDRNHERSSTRSQSRRSGNSFRYRGQFIYEPRSSKITIIDMGGATWDNDYHNSIIQTRQYRCPEVILECCRWDSKSDIWSIGCILAELYTGKLLLPTHDEYEHMAMIEKISGRVPKWMAKQCSNKLRDNFILDDELYFSNRKTYFDWPTDSQNFESVLHVRKLQRIEDIVSKKDYQFKDLLRRCLTVDPDKRISCSEALRHKFFDH